MFRLFGLLGRCNLKSVVIPEDLVKYHRSRFHRLLTEEILDLPNRVLVKEKNRDAAPFSGWKSDHFFFHEDDGTIKIRHWRDTDACSRIQSKNLTTKRNKQKRFSSFSQPFTLVNPLKCDPKKITFFSATTIHLIEWLGEKERETLLSLIENGRSVGECVLLW